VVPVSERLKDLLLAVRTGIIFVPALLSLMPGCGVKRQSQAGLLRLDERLTCKRSWSMPASSWPSANMTLPRGARGCRGAARQPS
jgi:hypothetical protein